MLTPGLYEQVINRLFAGELTQTVDQNLEVAAIDQAEATQILTQYLTEVILRGLDTVCERSGSGAARPIDQQVALVNKIVTVISQEIGDTDLTDLSVDEQARLLLAVVDRQQSTLILDERGKIPRPETSIAQSSLFTGAGHEPGLYTELQKEIASADRIDMLVSFIKWSGLRLIIDELRAFTQRGKPLRIISTAYMGATDIKAIDELSQLMNTEIIISYDTQRTRLHAKSYVFYRKSGFSTAYVGSSNLSRPAISSGLEWNIKLTAKDQAATFRKIEATFESYWNAPEFNAYTPVDRSELSRALRLANQTVGQASATYLFDIAPYPYQQEILDQLEAERTVRGYYRNLVVAATGTGKTVISAFDYKRFCKAHPGQANRLLFIAHREEILAQSLACFRGVLRDNNFGDLLAGGSRTGQVSHLFISIQTFHSRDFQTSTPRAFYDYIVIDEFHHAAARSYQIPLAYYQPQILLGLTATPERLDGQSILTYFGERIAAEIRLPEAIERKLLSPFQYFGVTDSIDLSALRWTRGGYDRSELSKVFTMDQALAKRRADEIVQAVYKYVTDLGDVKGLGFCVSVDHAQYMARHFNACGIPSICLCGQSDDTLRDSAKQDLLSGQIRMIFVVDLYNEGVDIPEINTVLFLRPTESLTIFLQQLGRGLRLAENKECLTVLDFVGQANQKYNFVEKFAALLYNTNRSVQQEIKDHFTSLPKGCYIQLERIAQRYILENISQSFRGQAGLVARLTAFAEVTAESGLPLSLATFVQYYHLDVRVVYQRINFVRLCVLARLQADFFEPAEESLNRSFLRLANINSRRWISFLMRILPDIARLDGAMFPPLEQRMLQMFYATVWQTTVTDWRAAEVQANLQLLQDSPVMRGELSALLAYNLDRIDFTDLALDFGFDCPLDLHCTYNMRQIMAALDYYNFGAMQGLGVKYLPEKQLDVFFITLNKSDKEYSPSTMYNDYSISDSLFHWQSQSTTAETSATGRRYIQHRQIGSKVALFVREFKKDAYDTAPYTFLGFADYVRHEGSRPMNITWRLQEPIPAKFLKKTNKLVV